MYFKYCLFIVVFIISIAGCNRNNNEESSSKRVDSISTMHYELIIIGSGPAGYTAALYAARAGIKPLVLAGETPGGQLTTTTDVENYPGFPDGIQGTEMMDLFQKQAERFETKVEYKHVEEVDFNTEPFILKCEDETYSADAVIIATGASAKWLGIPSEQAFNGYGVSACATCDGFFYKGKDVIIVGGGDTAMEEALFLSRLCNKVYVVHRRDSFRASKIMQQRVLNSDKIEVIWNHQLDEIIGDTEPRKKVTGARLKNTQDGSTKEISVSGVFIAIGHQPNSKIFKDFIQMDEVGYIYVDGRTSKTNIPGVFAAGDVCDKVYRQAVTSAGMGCMAAIDAERYLEEKKHLSK